MIISETWLQMTAFSSSLLITCFFHCPWPCQPDPSYSSVIALWSRSPFSLRISYALCSVVVFPARVCFYCAEEGSSSYRFRCGHRSTYIKWCVCWDNVGGRSLSLSYTVLNCTDLQPQWLSRRPACVNERLMWGWVGVCRDLMSLPTHFKTSYQGHVLLCFIVFSPPPPSLHSAVLYSESWHGTLAPGDYLSISPFLSSFFPPTEPFSKSFPSSLIPLLLLHHHNTSSPQTNYRHRGDLSCRRSI